MMITEKSTLMKDVLEQAAAVKKGQESLNLYVVQYKQTYNVRNLHS